jgi:uncharacterized protein YkwD
MNNSNENSEFNDYININNSQPVSQVDHIEDINQVNSQNNIFNENQNEDKLSQAYDSTFNVIVQIISEVDDEVQKTKIFKILNTLVKNLVEHPEEEKFRRLKLSNINIQSILAIKGIYDFLHYIGFEEKFIDGDLFLCMDIISNNELNSIIFSYLNLLITNEEDKNDNEYINENEIPNKSDRNLGYPSLEEINSTHNQSIQSQSNNFNQGKSSKKKTILDILKETKDSRIDPNSYFSTNKNSNQNKNLKKSNKIHPIDNSNQSTNNNNQISNTIINQNNNQNQYQPLPVNNGLNNYTSVSTSNQRSKKIDIKSILKETAAVRRNNSDYFPQSYNVVPNNNFPSSRPSGQSRFVTLQDLKFKNPDLNNVNRGNFNVNDEIGKKCLQLSNEFRQRNGLPPLQWDDHIWKISFEHSQNMGIYKVKFGHDGFNQRINKLPFHYHQANENVFMCSGVSEWSVSEMGVNGWINSPGHRKNLLSHTTHCAIATYRNNYGEYFLTQIFVRK